MVQPVHGIPMRAIVLAAGDGGRLNGAAGGVAKPLVPLNGRPIIEYTLDAISAAGVREVLVVTGYREAEVRNGLTAQPRPFRLEFASNPDFARGASLSLRKAHDFAAGTSAFLLMADHLLGARVLLTVANAYAGLGEASAAISIVAADSGPRDAAYIAEASKLTLAPGPAPRPVTAIGKDLGVWDALDAGAFILAPQAWETIAAAPADCELSVIFARLAADSCLRAADISGMRWYDVDTPADLAAAAEWLERHEGASRRTLPA